MARIAAALVLSLLVLVVPVSTQMRIGAPAGDFVELDVVVVDRKGQPVHGLTKEDFTVKDGGKTVTVSTFREFTGPDPRDPDSGRTIVILLDDTGVVPTGTSTIQTIARAIVGNANPRDDMPVVRLHAKEDEPYGDRIAAEERIAAYRAGSWPFSLWSTNGEVLERVSAVTAGITLNTARRRIILCIGAPFICNLPEPFPSAPRSFESLWMSTVTEAAKANVAVYGLVAGRPGRFSGLPEATGGEVFPMAYDIGPAIERVLSDASNYYVLGYWPVSESRRLQRVEVKVRAKGVKVLARRLR
ncbi:MAG: hypothetical protein AB7H96_21000 [Vicinamibacterales bacterium]